MSRAGRAYLGALHHGGHIVTRVTDLNHAQMRNSCEHEYEYAEGQCERGVKCSAV
jgi:hypothetical protein